MRRSRALVTALVRGTLVTAPAGGEAAVQGYTVTVDVSAHGADNVAYTPLAGWAPKAGNPRKASIAGRLLVEGGGAGTLDLIEFANGPADSTWFDDRASWGSAYDDVRMSTPDGAGRFADRKQLVTRHRTIWQRQAAGPMGGYIWACRGSSRTRIPTSTGGRRASAGFRDSGTEPRCRCGRWTTPERISLMTRPARHRPTGWGTRRTRTFRLRTRMMVRHWLYDGVQRAGQA